jgi:predicted DNA-binding transcriptional regulator AlpA
MSQEDKQEEEIITVKEAASLLGISKRTLYRYIKEGILHPVRENPMSLKKSEVERLLMAKAVTGKSDNVTTMSQVEIVPLETDLSKLISYLRELQEKLSNANREKEELIARLGYLQGRIEELEKNNIELKQTIKMLQAPKKRWWEFWKK